jgi:hypothetical protein
MGWHSESKEGRMRYRRRTRDFACPGWFLGAFRSLRCSVERGRGYGSASWLDGPGFRGEGGRRRRACDFGVRPIVLGSGAVFQRHGVDGTSCEFLCMGMWSACWDGEEEVVVGAYLSSLPFSCSYSFSSSSPLPYSSCTDLPPLPPYMLCGMDRHQRHVDVGGRQAELDEFGSSDATKEMETNMI